MTPRDASVRSKTTPSTLTQLAPKRLLVICRGLTDTQVETITHAAASRKVAIEIALRSADDINQLTFAKQLKTDCIIGAGTVTNTSLAKAAIDAGADFILSPNLDIETINYCVQHDAPIIAGAMTPTEVLNAWNAGATAVKVFPASPLGPSYIKQLLGPLATIPLVAVGGMGSTNSRTFIDAGCAAVGVGGAIANAVNPTTELDQILTNLAAEDREPPTSSGPTT